VRRAYEEGVRQGEITKGKWIGDPHGGVKAPQALMLPDPATRFANTAARLEVLSIGHPMEDWLRFMARLARAQHAASESIGLFPAVPQIDVEQAVRARMPPLSVDSHRRDARWREGLAMLLDSFDNRDIPEAAGEVVASLRQREANDVEVLADDFLYRDVDVADAGAVLYVAAALQVYFTHLAAALPEVSLRLLPERGLCPCCGSTPIAGVVMATGQTPGTRYLYCSVCSTAWNHVRAVCITCGQSRSVSLKEIDGVPGAVKSETCDECHTYSKVLYQTKDMKVDPFADDLATLGLDLLVGEAGWSRHAPNPLLLIAPGTSG
jgi:FdhE protein